MSASSAFYEASLINDFDHHRKRWPNSWLATLDDQLIQLLKEDWPQSVRHCFYCMTNPRLPVHVPKTETGYQKVQRRLVKLRKTGSIPYNRLVDSTRLGWHTHAYSGAGNFLAKVAGLYRHDLWLGNPVHVEVWVESGSIAGVLGDTCRELAVSYYPTRGFSSLTLPYEAAQEINRIDPERAVVLYVGDYDPAGVLIPERVESELRKHLKVELDLRRLAINEEQIEAYDLPTKPRKRGDRRRPDVKATVEAEAMPAHVLRELVRNAVEQYLPAGALRAAKVAEASERAVLMAIAEDAGGVIGE